jgi:serine/threonine protein kinase
MSIVIGRTLNHYKILDRLGKGGMAEVYVAEDTRLKRKVAIKVLPEEMAGDPPRLERFQREAEAIAALNHPNIVTIYSVEEAEDIRFLTMELVEGETLIEFIPAGGMEVADFLRISGPITEAISASKSSQPNCVNHRFLFFRSPSIFSARKIFMSD